MKNVELKYIRYIYKCKITNEIIYRNRKTV